MSIPDTLRDALLRVHAGRRALALAREVNIREAMDGAELPTTDDLIAALAVECARAEFEAAALLRDGFTDARGNRYGVKPCDRRSRPRPTFTFTRNAAGDWSAPWSAEMRAAE